MTDQDEYDMIVQDPKSCGYGFLPFNKPKISKADKNKFNPDKTADYLITGLDELGGYYDIDSAKLENGRLYLTIRYCIYVNPDSAYRYLKKAFKLTDDNIMSLDIFSESDCYLKGGHMITDSGSEREICSGIPVTEIMLSQMAVADDTVITIQTYFPTEAYIYSGYISFRITTAQFADYILQGENETDWVQLNNVWFKYSGDVITGIAEEYCP